LSFFSTATEVEWRHQEDGQKVRVSLRTGRIVPIPDEANDYHEDYTKIGGYKGMLSSRCSYSNKSLLLMV
jgi:hypothetical protein